MKKKKNTKRMKELKDELHRYQEQVKISKMFIELNQKAVVQRVGWIRDVAKKMQELQNS